MTVEDNNKKRAREEAKRKADQYCDKDGGPPDPTAVREELAGLDRIAYGQRREDLAAELGIMKGLLDEEYKAQRKAAEAAAAAAAPKSFLGKKDPEPWEEEVDGDALLDEIVLAINKYLVTPDGGVETMAPVVRLHPCDGLLLHRSVLCGNEPDNRVWQDFCPRLLSELVHRGGLFAKYHPCSPLPRD